LSSGTLTTILGPSGCGKTTVLRMVAGLESPTSGQILIAGKDVTTLGPADRNVSMMFQSYALFPHMNVVENVGYGLRNVRRGQGRCSCAGHRNLAQCGPGGLRRPSAQRTFGRAAAARGAGARPGAGAGVLLFDEPLSNLDARLRREMREEIRSLQQRLQFTVAYVTHDQSEALAVSDQIIVMDHGLIAQRGTPQDLYEFPGSEFVAGFMGEAMLFPAEADEGGTVNSVRCRSRHASGWPPVRSRWRCARRPGTSAAMARAGLAARCQGGLSGQLLRVHLRDRTGRHLRCVAGPDPMCCRSDADVGLTWPTMAFRWWQVT
jgi:iron(III) transport system ATP-binding protein